MVMTTLDGRALWAKAREETQRCLDSDHSLGLCASCIGSGKLGVIGESQYREERRLVDLDSQWSEQFRKPNGWTVITAEEQKTRPEELAAVDNAMRGRVEQYELLNNPPESFAAYIGSDGRSVTVWTGLKLGTATATGSWRSGYGTLTQYVCRIAGREYRGRSQGAGMMIALTETAESKRNRESI
jgi:hypothetical protein